MVVVYDNDVDQALRILRKKDGWKMDESKKRKYFRSKSQTRHDKDFHAAARRNWLYNR